MGVRGLRSRRRIGLSSPCLVEAREGKPQRGGHQPAEAERLVGREWRVRDLTPLTAHSPTHQSALGAQENAQAHDHEPECSASTQHFPIQCVLEEDDTL